MVSSGGNITQETGTISNQDVSIQVDDIVLPGILSVPENFRCTVIFAHGSGSSRFSTRNRSVSEVLNRAGIATLLFDLLTEGESAFQRNIFDISLLSERLVHATNWVADNVRDHGKEIGYFGASTGAAAALAASVESAIPIGAVVSRGGRPDLAMDILPEVNSPTLLLVGSKDFQVIELNEIAYGKLKCTKKLELVRNATHLFEEEGALEYVAEAAKNWFLEYLWVK